MKAKTAGKTKSQIEEKLARKTAIRERLNYLKDTIGAVSGAADHARRAVEEAYQRFNTFVAKATARIDKKALPGNVPEEERPVLEDLQSKAGDAEIAAAKAKAKFDEYTREIKELEQELADFEHLCTADDMLAHKREFGQATDAVASFETAIAEQEAIVAKATAEIFAPEDLSGRREDLLAEIALGKGGKDELEKLDAEISRQKAAHEESTAKAQAVIDPARQAIAGLQRKLDEARSRHDALKEKGGEILLHYLWTEAQNAGEDYLRLSGELVGVYRRLMALDAVLRAREADTSVRVLRGPFWDKLAIPSFNLPGHPEQEPPFPGYVFKAVQWPDLEWRQARHDEEERIRAAGVDL